MLLFLASCITNRLRYTVDLMLREMLGLKVEMTTSADQFRLYDGPKIAYSDALFPDALNIESSGLLFEAGIRQLGLCFFSQIVPVIRFLMIPFPQLFSW